MSVRVRIAPSPTGDPHVGTAYMALVNKIFAAHHEGTFILRIEDTDQTRSRKEYEDNVYKALQWANITWDEGPDVGGPYGPYRQSERTEIYQKYANELVESGKAYKCFCTSEDLAEMRELLKAKKGRQGYDRRCRNLSPEEIQEKEEKGLSYVIRLKMPLTGECVYEDLIKGRTTCPWADVDDQVLLKSDGFPTYHLANIVDDHLMKITHVIRGDEWMSSTPKHIYLYEAFGWEAPKFLHMPLLLGTDGKKLSKRKNPTSIFYYRDSGYLPEAFVNFLTLMGYSMADDKEIYSLDEIIKSFDVSRIGQSGAVFDVKKLEWLNQQYLINNIEEDKLWNRILDWGFSDETMSKIMSLCHTRMKTFGDFLDLAQFFFINKLPLTLELLTPKGITPTCAASILQCLIWYLEEQEDWKKTGFNTGSREIAQIFGANHKKIIMPLLFVTIQGKQQGLPLFDSAEVLGKDRARARLLQAIEFLGGISNKHHANLQKAWIKKDCSDFFKKSE
jgi:glutamyl-tRNA synthetase